MAVMAAPRVTCRGRSAPVDATVLYRGAGERQCDKEAEDSAKIALEAPTHEAVANVVYTTNAQHKRAVLTLERVRIPQAQGVVGGTGPRSKRVRGPEERRPISCFTAGHSTQPWLPHTGHGPHRPRRNCGCTAWLETDTLVVVCAVH